MNAIDLKLTQIISELKKNTCKKKAWGNENKFYLKITNVSFNRNYTL